VITGSAIHRNTQERKPATVVSYTYIPQRERSADTHLSHDVDYVPREPGPRPHEWIVAVFLFCATLISTTFAGLFHVAGYAGFSSTFLLSLKDPAVYLMGLSFSLPLMSILLAHELGHFIACRYYGMRCTPPFFLPAPVPVTGTLGAFIKIKSSFHHKRALFDIGVAGPLTGFLFCLPVLWFGIRHSELIPRETLGPGVLYFGEPLIFRLTGMIALGYSTQTHDLVAHPMLMAAWVGLLATSLNLLPIWQLDGGHIAYAVFGRLRQKRLSILMVVTLIFMSFWNWPTPSYLLFALLLLIIGIKARFHHPPTMDETIGLGRTRRWIGFVALLIFLLSFIPVPVSIT
jgi:membrane-associated protease RseP (regulator of RpoE activity)